MKNKEKQEQRYRRNGHMQIEARYIEQARKLHRENPVVDSHLDLGAELYNWVKSGEENPLRDRYLEHLREGGFNLIAASIFLENDQTAEGGLRTALDQISVLLNEIDKNKEFMQVSSAADLEQVVREDRIGILIYMEGLDCIGTDLRLLRILWELGVRGASLVWSRRNALGTGCCVAGRKVQIKGGLSEEGCLAVKELERLGMFIDISHLNDEGFDDLCSVARKPFVATHSNSRAIFFDYRNLSDEQMRRLAAQGGLMGLNGCKCIVGSEEGGDGLEIMCRHIEYETAMLGADRVGYGFDFCDGLYDSEPKTVYQESKGDCLEHHGQVPMLTAALLQRGMDEETVKKIIGGNWVTYFRRMLPEK
jgi:membrane dipeptidase